MHRFADLGEQIILTALSSPGCWNRWPFLWAVEWTRSTKVWRVCRSCGDDY